MLKYNLIEFAGSDNHQGGKQKKLAGMCSEKEISDELDFIKRIKNGEMSVFSCDLNTQD